MMLLGIEESMSRRDDGAEWRISQRRPLRLLVSWVLPLVLALLVGCTDGDPADGEASADGLVLDTEKRDPERLLRFYFGSYLGPDGGDAVEAGLLSGEGTDFRLYLDALDARWRPALDSANADGDGTLDWDELVDFFEATYAEARDLPPTLDAFRADAPYAAGDPDWFEVELSGVMTTARRHLFVPVSALRAALTDYRANEERLIYPIGTALIGEHRVEGELAETTVMRKRPDGFWDFFVYGADGTLDPATDTPPRALRSPVQCVGCHFGSKLFEPEESFPAEAPPGPFGPRGIHAVEDELLTDELRNAEVVAFFDEHAKRSDTALGVYNTLFVSGLLADRRAGRLTPDDAALLDGLGLPEGL
jgi:hypothetical protein